jgi:hypothetical protein
LYFVDEQTLPTAHPKLRAAYHRPYSIIEVSEAIDELVVAADGPEDEIRQKLREIVPEFRPDPHHGARLESKPVHRAAADCAQGQIRQRQSESRVANAHASHAPVDDDDVVAAEAR